MRILSFNLCEEATWKQNELIKILSRGDILLLQEWSQEFSKLLKNFVLDKYFYEFPKSKFNYSNVLISKVPIFIDENGVYFLCKNEKNYLFNVHLTDSPYQPYQLNKIDYGDGARFVDTYEEAFNESCKARCSAVLKLIEKTKDLQKVIICGDFNEPPFYSSNHLLLQNDFSRVTLNKATFHGEKCDEIDLCYTRGIIVKKIESFCGIPSDHDALLLKI